MTCTACGRDRHLRHLVADVVALGPRCIVGLVCRFCLPQLRPPRWWVLTIVSEEGSMLRRAQEEVWAALGRGLRCAG